MIKISNNLLHRAFHVYRSGSGSVLSPFAHSHFTKRSHIREEVSLDGFQVVESKGAVPITF